MNFIEISTIFVQILGAFRCGSCLLVIGVQNPIHSILLLIRVFFLGTFRLFLMQREYYAMLFLIVYVGAIVVLFLFIIRRLELKRINIAMNFRDLFIFRNIIVAFLLLEVLFIVSQTFFDLGFFFYEYFNNNFFEIFIESNFYIDWSKIFQRSDQLHFIGRVLYTEYKVTFIVVAFLLFLSRVGSIVISLQDFSKGKSISEDISFDKKSLQYVKIQDANLQAIRHPQL